MDFETNGVTADVDPFKLSDAQLTGLAQEVVEAARERDLELPAFAAGTLTVAESLTPVESAPLTSETLLATLDTALITYSSQLDVTNSARAEVKGNKKPAQLKATDQKKIRTEVEELVVDPAILAELQTEIDYFTENPEVDSPDPGFDLMIVPEGLTANDEEAIACDLQAKLPSNYEKPYVRPPRYNDTRLPEVTGKGFRIAFAPRHYNVPNGVPSTQTRWVKVANEERTATELQTATDGEALAQVTNLYTDHELDEPNTRYHKTYYSRFDQKPVGDCVSRVCVIGGASLFLDRSRVCYERPTRALVVPKA